MEKKVVAIHQPNFLPWLGYFHKLVHCDVFVFFDDVQLPRGKSFVSRVLIKSPNGPQWLTVPVSRKGEKNLINTTQISNGSWKNKVLKSLHFNYQKAEYFEELYKGLEDIFNRDHSLLIDLNIALITFIKDFLGLSTQLQRSSEICQGTDIPSDQKILYILNKLNATTYVSGAGSGSKRYIDEKEFESNNIDLIWQQFDHPEYFQLFGDFEPNLSIIDLLFNCGKDYSRKLLKDIPLTVI